MIDNPETEATDQAQAETSDPEPAAPAAPTVTADPTPTVGLATPTLTPEPVAFPAEVMAAVNARAAPTDPVETGVSDLHARVASIEDVLAQLLEGLAADGLNALFKRLTSGR